MAGINRKGVTNNSPQGQSEGRNGKGFGLAGMRYAKAGSSPWEPTVGFLLILVIVEVFGYAAFRYGFKGVHGG